MENVCVSCGMVIPEGEMLCDWCARKVNRKRKTASQYVMELKIDADLIVLDSTTLRLWRGKKSDIDSCPFKSRFIEYIEKLPEEINIHCYK